MNICVNFLAPSLQLITNQRDMKKMINFSLFECIGFHIVLVVLRGKTFYVPPWLDGYSFFELIKFVLVPSMFLYLTNQHIFMILFSNINNYIQIIYHKFYYNFF